MRKISIALLLTVLFSCSSPNDIPTGILTINEMKPIVWDMLRAGGLAEVQITRKDSVIILKKNTDLYQQVFRIYHISKEDFYKSYEYYQQHPDRNKILMDSVIQYANRQRQELFKTFH